VPVEVTRFFLIMDQSDLVCRASEDVCPVGRTLSREHYHIVFYKTPT
jgi:hypothetical protein